MRMTKQQQQQNISNSQETGFPTPTYRFLKTKPLKI
jgi:hypothetical protein